LLFNHLDVKTEEGMLQDKFPGYFITDNGKDRFDVDFGGMPRLS
jgi:hypothetical protein